MLKRNVKLVGLFALLGLGSNLRALNEQDFARAMEMLESLTLQVRLSEDRTQKLVDINEQLERDRDNLQLRLREDNQRFEMQRDLEVNRVTEQLRAMEARNTSLQEANTKQASELRTVDQDRTQAYLALEESNSEIRKLQRALEESERDRDASLAELQEVKARDSAQAQQLEHWFQRLNESSAPHMVH